MDTAFNINTKEIVNAWALELKDPTYQFPYEEKWFADPNEIQSYDKTKVSDVCKIEVRFRKASYDVINFKGTKYDMPPSFFILNKEELGINTIPESKEHKIAKHWIYNTCRRKELNFIFSTVKRPFDYNNKINLKELNIVFEKIDIEVPVNIGRRKQRADVIVPLSDFHDLIGTGVVIEIQFSKQTDQEKEERTINWALKGYSICWINLEDIENISEDFIELKSNNLNLEVYAKTIKNYSEKYEHDFRVRVQEVYRACYDKIKEFNELVISLKKDLDKYSNGKIIETSESIIKLKDSLSTREANLISNLSKIENNPLKETFELYKNKLNDLFVERETKLQNEWEMKMKELNYPFFIRNCPMCNHGILYLKTTKTGKECYGCSNYPECKHTIWINNK